MLDRLRQARGEQLNKYPTLAAAICVVHDRPLVRRFNENQARAGDPVAIFDYYVKNESRMAFGIKPVPAELLIYVVNATASIEEMEWALQRYAGHPAVGRLFFDIKYDNEHLRTGRPKRITTEGFTLNNILAFGGVCCDQAYFASSVGKAIGVPTAVAEGAAGETGHSWVGFLASSGRSGWWNFDTGRYEAYRGIRGIVLDPQSRERIPDSFVSLLAELIGTTPANRQAGTALADAAQRLMELEKSGRPLAPPPLEDGATGGLSAPRQATSSAALDLLDLAVRQSPGDRSCWIPLHELALAGKMTLNQKRKWSDTLLQVCGTRYPDFMMAILTPMVQTVDDVREQDRMWNMMFDMFHNRSDLAAAVRMGQAAMWQKKNETTKAGLCYYDVIEKFPNAGPFVIDALAHAEKALRNLQHGDRVVMLYEQTWQRIHKPREMAGPFTMQSNWYRVGQLLAQKLDEAGEGRKAETVRAQLAGA